MQFTTTSASLSPTQPSTGTAQYDLDYSLHRLLRRHLLSSLDAQEIRGIDKPTFLALEEDFGSKSPTHRFLLNLYLEEKKKHLGHHLEHGFSDLDLDDEQLVLLGTSEFYQDIIEKVLLDPCGGSSLGNDLEPTTKLIRWIADVLSKEKEAPLLLCDLDFDYLILLDHRGRKRPVASITQNPYVAAINILLAIIYDIPLSQHLCTEEELEKSLRSGILPGCLAQLQLGKSHLLRLIPIEKPSMGADLPLYQKMGFVSLITPTQFLQRDEAISFREELLNRKALQSLINLDVSVSLLMTLGIPSPDWFTQPQSIWHFSFQSSSPSFRFVDSSNAFKDYDPWTSPRRFIDKPLNCLADLVNHKPDEVHSFQIRPEEVVAPLSMLRLIDYRNEVRSPITDGQKRVRIIDLFELVSDTDRFDHPRKAALFDIFNSDHHAGLWELIEPEDDEPEPQFTDEEMFHFLIHPTLHQGRLQIVASGELHTPYSEHFGLRVKNSAPEYDPRVLFILLSADDFLVQLSPYFHGTTKPKFHPTDFMNAQLTLPCARIRKAMEWFLRRVSTSWGGRTNRDYLRQWQIDFRGLHSLWPIERPEENLEEYRIKIEQDAERGFREEVDLISHNLGNRIATTYLKLLNEANLDNPSILEDFEKIDKDLARLTSPNKMKTLQKSAEPYCLMQHLEENMDLFEGLVDEIKILPPQSKSDDTKDLRSFSRKPTNSFRTRLAHEAVAEIVQNLVTNAKKHNSTPNSSTLKMRVEFKPHHSNGFDLVFSNNGTPFPQGFTTSDYIKKGEAHGPHAGTGVGGFLILNWMRAINGQISIVDARGSDYPVNVKLTFPKV